jgi:hypothetical protein
LSYNFDFEFEAWRQFGNPEEEKLHPLEAVIRKLVKTQRAEKIEVCAVVNCKMCRTVEA